MSMTRAWTAVALLTLVGMINMIDRAMPGVMVEPIKHDLQLSDSALGLVNGFGFLLVYSVMGIPIARLADRAAYGLVISGCIALWSAMTLLGSFVHNGWQLAVTRMGVALGEAGNTPAAHAFVARNFAPQSRAAPLSVLALSVPLAVITAIIGGGLIAALYGWRTTFATMGIAGLVIAPLVLWLLGPRQAPAASVRPAAARPLAAGLALLGKRSFAMIMVASAFIGIGGYALATFAVAFLMRSHGMPLAEVSVHYGEMTRMHCNMVGSPVPYEIVIS
jgi:predicted MFS family arabinose efflux permease